jgi:hypothetical protein
MQDHLNQLDKKYNVLKDQLSKYTKIIEEDNCEGKKNIKKSPERVDEIKLFENKVKGLLFEERNVKKIN